MRISYFQAHVSLRVSFCGHYSKHKTRPRFSSNAALLNAVWKLLKSCLCKAKLLPKQRDIKKFVFCSIGQLVSDATVDKSYV